MTTTCDHFIVGGTCSGCGKTEAEINTDRKGFASMDRDRQFEIASKGGRSAHAKGTAHEWTSEEAREAGRKGGQASRGGRGKGQKVDG